MIQFLITLTDSPPHSKSKKVSVSNFQGATSEDILEEIEDILNSHPDTLIFHASTSQFIKNINTLRNVKNICEKTKRVSPDTKVEFSNTIYRKGKRNINKQHCDTVARKILFS